ncbi:MAG: hypothetical protein AB1650_02055 [Candidatus Omnitrophota bacterium]
MLNWHHGCYRLIIFIMVTIIIASGSAVSDNNPSYLLKLDNFISAVLNNHEAGEHGRSLIESFKDDFPTIKNADDEIGRLNDQVNYIVFLESRIRFFNKNNGLLMSFLEPFSQQQDVADGLSRFKGQLDAVHEKTFQSGLHDLQYGDFHGMRMVLRKLESRLSSNLQELQVINDGFRSIKMGVLKKGLVKQQGVNDGEVSRLNKILNERKSVVERQNIYIQGLQKQVDEMKLGLEIFRERLQETNQKVDRLTKEFAAASLDLFETQKNAADKGEKADFFESELSETKERLRLIQRIIQEKDEHIQTLEQEMLIFQERFGRNNADGELVSELRGEVNDLVRELRNKIDQSQKKIALLDDGFREIALKNAHLESELLKRDLALSSFKKQIAQKDGMIDDLEKAYRSREQKIFELKGIVKIYQLKLLDYRAMVMGQEITDKNDAHNRGLSFNSLDRVPEQIQGQDFLTVSDLPQLHPLSLSQIQISTKGEIKKIYDAKKP